ncbi:MAG: hypothetical protein H7A44_11650 [Opitutaceae bacterium]|nr:hypothetical protein [Opitutaceae bacterium]
MINGADAEPKIPVNTTGGDGFEFDFSGGPCQNSRLNAKTEYGLDLTSLGDASSVLKTDIVQKQHAPGQIRGVGNGFGG